MYGLTDNIVAGPAGQVVAGPAGSFVAGPAGSFTPAPGGHTPVYPVTAGMPPSGAGYVPIDTTPAQIPYAAHSGPLHMVGGSTQSPIPGPQASIPYSANTGGGSTSGTGGIMYMSSVGAGAVGGSGSSAIVSVVAGGAGGGGGGGAVALGGGGGGISVGGGGGAVAVGGGGGGGAVAMGGGGMIAGGGISGGGGGGPAPSASTSSGGGMIAGGGGGGALSGGGGGISGGGGGGAFSGGGGGGGGGLGGPGIAPVEVRMGSASVPATGSSPGSPATPGNPVTPGGRVVPSPVGYLHPPPALRFHAPQYSRISRHPVHVETHTTTTETWQGFKPSYVWQGREPADASPPFLASDFLKASPYEPPHLLFRDERVGLVSVDATPGVHGSVDLRQSVTTNLFQDFSQTRNQEFSNNTYNDRNVVLDNSITRVVEQSFPEFRQSTVNIVQPQAAAQAAPSLEPNLPMLLGGPVMARVA